MSLIRILARQVLLVWFLYVIKTDSNLGFWGRARQLASRFTWEFLQTTTGYLWSHARNIVGAADRVDYYEGATFVTNENSTKGSGVSLGSYINVNIMEGVIDNEGTLEIYKDNTVLFKSSVEVKKGGFLIVYKEP